jgi:hypothetical protein
MATNIKPRLQWQSGLQRWACHDDHYIKGYGKTFAEAYDDWNKKQNRRTLVPRKNVWNLRCCRAWWNRGCPPLRTYLGDKQIFGYLRDADMLILRG